jgi:hypothetical protein
MDALVETVPLTYGGSTVNKVYTCLSLFTGNAKLILFPIYMAAFGWRPRTAPISNSLLCLPLAAPVGLELGKGYFFQPLEAGSKVRAGIVVA